MTVMDTLFTNVFLQHPCWKACLRPTAEGLLESCGA